MSVAASEGSNNSRAIKNDRVSCSRGVVAFSTSFLSLWICFGVAGRGASSSSSSSSADKEEHKSGKREVLLFFSLPATSSSCLSVFATHPLKTPPEDTLPVCSFCLISLHVVAGNFFPSVRVILLFLRRSHPIHPYIAQADEPSKPRAKERKLSTLLLLLLLSCHLFSEPPLRFFFVLSSTPLFRLRPAIIPWWRFVLSIHIYFAIFKFS